MYGSFAGSAAFLQSACSTGRMLGSSRGMGMATAISITDTASIVIKVTGQNGTANAGDISCRAMTVEVL